MMPVRIERMLAVARRTLWLAAELSAAIFYSRTEYPRSDALWLHDICHRLLRVFGIKLNVTGTVPTRGLLVANHLSYLDIIVIGALRPCVFVAKSEVKCWPVFGWFACKASTLFVNRNSRRDTIRVTREIRA